MEPGNIRAELRTEIGLKPERSHVFVVTLAGIAAFCFAIGFLFLWFKPNHSWVPFFLGGVCLVLSCVAWNRSHKNVDLANAVPTRIVDESTGIQVTTDTRALMSPEPIQHLERLFSLLSHREPLPEPDGLVGIDGSILPNSKDEAIRRIHEANKAAADTTKLAMTFLSGGKDIKRSEQPRLDEPLNDVLLKTNLPAE